MRSTFRAALFGVIVGIVVGFVAAALNMPGRNIGGIQQTPRVESFQRTGDGRQIVVVVMVGLGDQIVEASAREDARTVTPIVRVSSPAGVRPAIGILIPVTILLRDGLGGRAVLDERGQRVLDLGNYQPAREPPVELGDIGVVEKGSFTSVGDTIDFRWRNAAGTSTQALADLRGSTIVILSRTSFSSESKMSLLAVQQHISSLTPTDTARIVVLVITLNEDPARAAVVRPGATFRSLLAYSDTTGPDAPGILRFTSVPVTWFVGPDGTVRHRIEGRPASLEDVVRGLAAART